MQSSKEKTNIGDKITEFIQKNRKGLFIGFGLIVLMFVGVFVYYFVSESLNKSAIAQIDDFNRRFSDMHFDITEGNITDDIEGLLEELKTFGKKHSGFAGSKAWSMAGEIYSSRVEWAASREAWLNAAEKGDKTYLGPISLFTAAAISEEMGDTDRAIELYKAAATHSFEFPAAPRAQFSVGRLYETSGNFSMAVEAYREVMIKWPDIPDWQHLARSRIIFIEAR
ncbi:MAG: tetratricopeptide repeat protein [Treponema sp.]|nr:tetratricopeptide repeat protein [Treponema sp.]